MLVLLIIFMVTAPMMQRGLDVNLPAARRAQQLTEERLFVTVPSPSARTTACTSGKERVRLELLQERMRQVMQDRTDKQVFLQGDAGSTRAGPDRT